MVSAYVCMLFANSTNILSFSSFNLDSAPVETETFVTFAMLDNVTHGKTIVMCL